MQEYYLDGSDNKTKSSFYQDINSGIYNNVAIGKVYFDNRLLWSAPKKKYAIINIYKMSRIRTIENNQYNYLTYDINFTKGALPEYYNVAEKDSPAAIYAKEGKLYSTADYAYFSELRLLNSYMGFGGIPTEGFITGQPIDIGNSNIWFNKSNYYGSYNDGYMTFSNCYWNYQNITFPNTVTNLFYTFSNAWGLTWQLPLKCSDSVLNMYYTYSNAGGGVEFVNGELRRKNNISQWSSICLNGYAIGNNVLSMDSTFSGSSLATPPFVQCFFGPNTTYALETYKDCPLITELSPDWGGHSVYGFFPNNLSYISRVFVNCQNLNVAVIGVPNEDNTTIWDVYRDCPNISKIIMSPETVKCTGKNTYCWCIEPKKSLNSQYELVLRASGCYNLLNVFHLTGSLGYNAIMQINNMSFSMSPNIIDFSYCAAYCSNLNYFDFEGRNVINIAWCFFNCHNLKQCFQRDTSLSIFRNDVNIVNMGYTFCDCYNLQYDNTGLIQSKHLVDMQCCYYNCVNLEYINISFGGPWTPIGGKNLQYISAAFQNCFNLEGNFIFLAENIKYGDLFGNIPKNQGRQGKRINLYIKSNTLTNNSFFKEYGREIWENNLGYGDINNNIYIYYADKNEYWRLYKDLD